MNFNNSYFPRGIIEIEFGSSSSIENFTDTSTTELIERFSDSGSTSSRLSEILSGVSSSDSLDRRLNRNRILKARFFLFAYTFMWVGAFITGPITISPSE